MRGSARIRRDALPYVLRTQARTASAARLCRRIACRGAGTWAGASAHVRHVVPRSRGLARCGQTIRGPHAGRGQGRAWFRGVDERSCRRAPGTGSLQIVRKPACLGRGKAGWWRRGKRQASGRVEAARFGLRRAGRRGKDNSVSGRNWRRRATWGGAFADQSLLQRQHTTAFVKRWRLLHARSRRWRCCTKGWSVPDCVALS